MNGHNFAAPEPGKHRILLVGSGKLAHALALTIPEEIAGVMVRDADRFATIGSLVPLATLVFSLDELAHGDFDTIWIATSDRAIPEVAERIAAGRERWDGVTVIHSSGAGSISLLAPFAVKGACTLVLHPNASFTGESPIPAGLLWTISSNMEKGREIVRDLLASIDPTVVTVADESRPLYHAAASAASNYSLALFMMAVDLYRRAGLDERDARTVVARFMCESAERALDGDARELLTGPISRGDHEIVERQLDTVAREAPELLDAFTALGRMTASLVCREDEMEEWRKLFGARPALG